MLFLELVLASRPTPGMLAHTRTLPTIIFYLTLYSSIAWTLAAIALAIGRRTHRTNKLMLSLGLAACVLAVYLGFSSKG